MGFVCYVTFLFAGTVAIYMKKKLKTVLSRKTKVRETCFVVIVFMNLLMMKLQVILLRNTRSTLLLFVFKSFKLIWLKSITCKIHIF